MTRHQSAEIVESNRLDESYFESWPSLNPINPRPTPVQADCTGAHDLENYKPNKTPLKFLQRTCFADLSALFYNKS